MARLGQFRRDTLANWRANNPVLADGEFALIAQDPSKPKFYNYWVCGDGTTAFNRLPMMKLADSAGITGISDEVGESQSIAISQNGLKIVKEALEKRLTAINSRVNIIMKILGILE